jgi:calcium-independent phospholipase A2-gamma
MEALYNLYRDLSAKVFKQSPLWGTSKLVWTHAYYDTTLWEKLLKEHVKETTLLDSTRFDNSPKV